MRKIVFLSLIFINSLFAGVSFPDHFSPNPNPFNDKIHPLNFNLPPINNFTHTTSNNFTILNWAVNPEPDVYVAIWRAKYQKFPEVISNCWSGYSCIAILPSSFNSFTDKANILSTHVIKKPILQVINDQNGADLKVSNLTPDYYWFLEFSNNLKDWYVFDDFYYGYGNATYNDPDNKSRRFYNLYTRQYVTDYHYFIYSFKPKIINSNIVDESRYPSQGLGLSNLSDFEMSPVVFLNQ